MKNFRRFRFHISSLSLAIFVSLTFSLAFPGSSDALPPGVKCGFPQFEQPDFPQLGRAMKPVSPKQIEIGTIESFWVRSFIDFSSYEIEATCLYVGEKSYIFVEREKWDDGTVNQDDVNYLADAFEFSTPADTYKGVYDLDVETFGEPSDVDGDPRIYILVFDIRDGYSSPGEGFYAGYVDPEDILFPPGSPPDWSNAKEIIYIDCYPLLTLYRDSAPATLAHELQHLIHLAYDPYEEVWVNEGCSGYAEIMCGYETFFGDFFLKDPNNSLIDWADEMADYDQTMMFITYISDHYGGKNTIAKIISDERHGIEGIDSALASAGIGVVFEDIFSGWTVANYLDGEGIYGYPRQDVPEISEGFIRFRLYSIPTLFSENLEPWAASYLEIIFQDAFQIGFEGVNGNYHLLSIGGGENYVGEFDLEDGSTGDFQIEGRALTALVIARSGRDDPGHSEPYSYILSAESPQTDIKENEPGNSLPLSSTLKGNFPNPFNSSTTIYFDISPEDAGGSLSLTIYNAIGKKIRVIADGRFPSGFHRATWDGKDGSGFEVGSGTYIFVLETEARSFSRKGLLLR